MTQLQVGVSESLEIGLGSARAGDTGSIRDGLGGHAWTQGQVSGAGAAGVQDLRDHADPSG